MPIDGTAVPAARRRLCFEALPGIPEVRPGDALDELVMRALDASAIELAPDTIVVVAQKIVSKAEGRFAWLDEVRPSDHALELARITGKDPRLVELTLAESTDVLRAVPGVLIVRHRLGYVMANAGIDLSNVPGKGGRERALLLPLAPDASAAALREALRARTDTSVGVIISDSFGRPWRNGVVNVALGSAGIPALIDRRGETDRHGRTLQITQTAFADAIAAGAAIVMGEGDEGMPVVLASGFLPAAPEVDCKALLRPLEGDLFQ
ncbi:coenzyme F420-0:L-glutamate ligase [Aromatoleum toluclasticum]|uniref:coenzyme F420-0:L-glutamate ligase n=1 Tax=Aromatoleum toluclasticum TaxID=92003 RepID=UPI000376E0D6|nr:coenzyme F420-0:L-glutamate ligase [Aromatoleum toluclasticum]